MQWILVVLLSLCCCEVIAKKCGDESECHKKMRNGWLDKKFKHYKLKDKDKAYLRRKKIRQRASVPPGRRPECRALSDEERGVMFDAYKWMFTTRNTPDGLTRYQIFVSQHRYANAPGAHFGPCFPPWHREFLLRFEQALQEYDSSVNLCYWDSSLDSSLPDATQSALWTPEFFGNGDGYVTTGFAANQSAFPPDCATNWPRLYRSSGGNSYLFNRNKINSTVLSYTTYQQLVSPYTSNNFETYHGAVHVFVDGHMSDITCAVNDPVFFCHHAFIDYLWELARQRQTTNSDEYPRYPPVPNNHRANDIMLPFDDLNCIDGLSDNYIPGLYSYAPSPYTCATHADCGGKALWCNSGKCTACVGPNGRMGTNWPNAACYITNCATPRNVNQVCKCGP